MKTQLITLSLLFSVNAQSTVWTVGPTQTYTAPSQVAGLVGNGDTVDIIASVYTGDVTNWTADDLLLRSINGRPHLDANGQGWGGKGIWVIQGDRNIVENIEFSNCAVPDNNGAGIRFEGSYMEVRNCYFHDNENGILAGTPMSPPSNITIVYSEFDNNGYGDGFSHNLYINHTDTLIFRYNYSHHAHVGHELKSRANVNFIEYNRLSNEASGDASREIDLPDGGQAFVIGNILHQGLQGQNSNMLGYGLESLSNPGPHELHVINNTFVNERNVGSFLQMPSTVFLKAYNNIMAGDGSFISGGIPPTGADTISNLQEEQINIIGFVDPSNYNYIITPASMARSGGIPAGYSNSGYPLVAWDEYLHPTGSVVRCQHATLDVGAHEHCTVGIEESADGTVLFWPNPSNGMISVRSTRNMRFMEVLDDRGRVILSRNVNSPQEELNLGDLSSGSYTLRITHTNGSLTHLRGAISR